MDFRFQTAMVFSLKSCVSVLSSYCVYIIKPYADQLVFHRWKET